MNGVEAFPGVLTPLGWTFLASCFERGARAGFGDMGILGRAEARTVPADPDQHILGVFYGRAAINVDFLRAMSDRIPGASSDAVERQLFGSTRPGVSESPTRRRYPVIALKLPAVAVTLPRRIRALETSQANWWLSCRTEPPNNDPDAAARMSDAVNRFASAMRLHSIATLLGQACYDQIAALATRAGLPGHELELMTACNITETEISRSLWEVSRGRLDMPSLLANHGFHGTGEGEISSTVWWDDRNGLERLVRTYAAMPDNASPEHKSQDRAGAARRADADLLSRLSGTDRVAASALLPLARRVIPLREITKKSFLQAIDAGRGTARAWGRQLARRDLLADPKDIFFCCLDELGPSGPPDDIRERIAARKAHDRQYQTVALPERWTGQPTAVVPDRSGELPPSQVQGVPAASGIAEGSARVCRDLDDALDLEEGEILICKLTDPSWTAVFHVAAAVVVDVGGPMSHGAIVARELGLPCVINTRIATQVFRSGDRIRVDGANGLVTLLNPSRDRSAALPNAAEEDGL